MTPLPLPFVVFLLSKFWHFWPPSPFEETLSMDGPQYKRFTVVQVSYQEIFSFKKDLAPLSCNIHSSWAKVVVAAQVCPVKLEVHWMVGGLFNLVSKARLAMVFCYQNCSDLLWEISVLVIKKNSWNSRLTWRARISKKFGITRTIYSNSEMSEQFLVKLRHYVDIDNCCTWKILILTRFVPMLALLH